MYLNKNFRKLVRRKSYSDTNVVQDDLVQEPKLQRRSANIQKFGIQNNQPNKNVLSILVAILFLTIIFSISLVLENNSSSHKNRSSSSIPSNYSSSYSSSNYTSIPIPSSDSSSSILSSDMEDTTSKTIEVDYTEVTLNKDVLEQLGYELNRDSIPHSDCIWCDLTKNGEKVTSFDIPATYEYNGNKYKITAIGKNCFSDSTLNNVTIPDTVTEIEEGAFFMSSISSINIPNSVTKIGTAAFTGCDSLKSIVVPESVIDAEGAFSAGMGGYVSVVYYMGEEPKNWGIGPTYKKYSSENETVSVEQQSTSNQNIIYTEVILDKKVLYQLGYNPADKKNFTSVKIPYTYEFKGKHYKITKVGEKAFYNYGALQKVTIEEGVQIIGVSAFENCTALTTVNLPSSINKINNNVFANCKALKSVNLPDGLTELRDSLFFNCLSLSNIEIPSSVTKIGDMVFYKCKSLENITIPENVTLIGQSAFAGCRGLKGINIPSNVTTIKQWAFSNCVSLNRVDIPDTVTAIGDEAFSNVESIFYDGNASGKPWDAKKLNGVEIKKKEKEKKQKENTQIANKPIQQKNESVNKTEIEEPVNISIDISQKTNDISLEEFFYKHKQYTNSSLTNIVDSIVEKTDIDIADIKVVEDTIKYQTNGKDLSENMTILKYGDSIKIYQMEYFYRPMSSPQNMAIALVSSERNGIKTKSGIQVGDSVQDLQGAYISGLTETATGYIIDDNGCSIVFQINDYGIITKIFIFDTQAYKSAHSPAVVSLYIIIDELTKIENINN